MNGVRNLCLKPEHKQNINHSIHLTFGSHFMEGIKNCEILHLTQQTWFSLTPKPDLSTPALVVILKAQPPGGLEGLILLLYHRGADQDEKKMVVTQVGLGALGFPRCCPILHWDRIWQHDSVVRLKGETGEQRGIRGGHQKRKQLRQSEREN